MKPEDLLSLYGTHSRSINSYNTIIWAFPILFVGMLATVYNYFHHDTCAMIIVAVFGYILIHAFFKHTYIHEHIRDALRNVEDELKKTYNSEGKKIIPSDEFCWLFKKPFLSHNIVKWSLLIINTLVLIRVLLSKC